MYECPQLNITLSRVSLICRRDALPESSVSYLMCRVQSVTFQHSIWLIIKLTQCWWTLQDACVDYRVLPTDTTTKDQKFTYSSILHTYPQRSYELMPCGIYRQLNYILQSNYHISKWSKIIFNQLVINDCE